jgi:hypothetical protein
VSTPSLSRFWKLLRGCGLDVVGYETSIFAPEADLSRNRDLTLSTARLTLTHASTAPRARAPHRWPGRGQGLLIFYNASPWVFTAVYLTFGMLVLLTLWFVPVRWPASLIQMRRY